MENPNAQQSKIFTLTNGILLAFIPVLLGLFIFQLLLGYSGLAYQEFLSSFAFFPSLYISAILISVFFSKGKKGYMWAVIGVDLIYRVVLFFVFNDGSWGALGLIITGVVEIAALVITGLILSVLMKSKLKRQTTIINALFVLLIVLITIQRFGLLRPGLIE